MKWPDGPGAGDSCPGGPHPPGPGVWGTGLQMTLVTSCANRLTSALGPVWVAPGCPITKNNTLSGNGGLWGSGFGFHPQRTPPQAPAGPPPLHQPADRAAWTPGPSCLEEMPRDCCNKSQTGDLKKRIYSLIALEARSLRSVSLGRSPAVGMAGSLWVLQESICSSPPPASGGRRHPSLGLWPRGCDLCLRVTSALPLLCLISLCPALIGSLVVVCRAAQIIQGNLPT